ncbi:hypothetical protein Clacol_005460 [Clathrus columnatus]|uniref:Uncharacterized protein n=1 Tax=Clathrus columnatus TaxID=1419009 RepID=A0AAV5ADN0_9AGAM|nr:hypothetical protein Clacol_005460 [Clathrus columnatus]
MRREEVLEALIETGLVKEENYQCYLKALGWIDKCQLQNEAAHHKATYRHSARAWPFANKKEGYAVSDCTGEALKAVLYSQKRLVSDQRLFDVVDNLLSFRDRDGRSPTYEPSRGSSLLEYINSSDTFGEIDYGIIAEHYPKCTWPRGHSKAIIPIGEMELKR